MFTQKQLKKEINIIAVVFSFINLIFGQYYYMYAINQVNIL